ncbi:MAG: prepilin peptidase [Lachnospiraceae bacterium]|nr:prepilin peptidase [Lachnospiraceae bacterium]
MTVKIILFLLLIICSITDIKYGYVDIRIVLTGLILSLVCNIREGGPPDKALFIRELMKGSLPGIFMFVSGFISEGAIGEGDSFLVLAAGMMTGFTNTLQFMCISWLFALVSGTILFILRKDLKGSFPFVPCMLAGYTVLFLNRELFCISLPDVCP